MFHKLEFIFSYSEDILKSSDTQHFEQLRRVFDLLSTNTVECRLSEPIGTWGGSDERFFRIIDQMRSHNKTTYTHTVIYCTL